VGEENDANGALRHDQVAIEQHLARRDPDRPLATLVARAALHGPILP
jgi:hypothetical protein